MTSRQPNTNQTAFNFRGFHMIMLMWKFWKKLHKEITILNFKGFHIQRFLMISNQKIPHNHQAESHAPACRSPRDPWLCLFFSRRKNRRFHLLNSVFKKTMKERINKTTISLCRHTRNMRISFDIQNVIFINDYICSLYYVSENDFFNFPKLQGLDPQVDSQVGSQPTRHPPEKWWSEDDPFRTLRPG